MLNGHQAIPILQKHLNFLVERHGLYVSGEQLRPEALADVFTTTWTRNSIHQVVQKGLGHLIEVCIIPIFVPSNFLIVMLSFLRVTNSGMFNVIGKWRCSKRHQNPKSNILNIYVLLPMNNTPQARVSRTTENLTFGPASTTSP